MKGRHLLILPVLPFTHFVPSTCMCSVMLLEAFLVVTAPLDAAPIYSQVIPTEPVGAFSSLDAPGGQKVADNFVLEGTGPITVRSIRFIGGYGLTNPPPSTPPLDELPTDSFRVVFLEDTGGSPGVPIVGGEFVIGSAFQRAPTGGTLLNGVVTPLEFIINLGDGIALSPSTQYWIAVVNDPGPEHGWTWARASGLVDQLSAGTRDGIATGPWNIFVNGGMWFELNDMNIPEPKSAALSVIAAAAILRLRKRGGANRPTTDLSFVP